MVLTFTESGHSPHCSVPPKLPFDQWSNQDLLQIQFLPRFMQNPSNKRKLQHSQKGPSMLKPATTPAIRATPRTFLVPNEHSSNFYFASSVDFFCQLHASMWPMPAACHVILGAGFCCRAASATGLAGARGLLAWPRRPECSRPSQPTACFADMKFPSWSIQLEGFNTDTNRCSNRLV